MQAQATTADTLPKHKPCLKILAGVLLGRYYPPLGEQMKPPGDAHQDDQNDHRPDHLLHDGARDRQHAGHAQFGRVGLEALIYCEVVRMLALIVRLIIANAMQPGAGINDDPPSTDTRSIQNFVAKSNRAVARNPRPLPHSV